jgi:alcohol dehydrogenase YqhD (iron-dependent ADH family)
LPPAFCYDGDVWDLFIGKATIEGALPVFAILTLAATGSEMNPGRGCHQRSDQGEVLHRLRPRLSPRCPSSIRR